MKILFFAFLMLPALAFADVYKCVVDGSVTYSASPCGSGNEPLFKDSRPSKIVLTKDGSGTFFGHGIFNGVPVNFQADTGAALTTVSGRVAYAAGFRTCVQNGRVLATANGQIRDCVIKANIDFGSFVLTNYTVTVAPNMQADLLLASDVLSTLNVELRNGVMTISR